MTFAPDDPAVDQVRVSVLVEVSPEEAFRVFTEDIDLWWRRGLKYRVASGRAGSIHLEPGVGGRLYESTVAGGDTETKQTGRVTAWEPPHRLCRVARRQFLSRRQHRRGGDLRADAIGHARDGDASGMEPHPR